MFNKNSVIENVNEFPNLSEKEQCKRYPQYLKSIYFEKFRNISNLQINFNHPVSIITGNNRCGKTTVLLALACSHYNFQKRDFSTGIFKRTTWGDLMRFTNKDIQLEDWTYFIENRKGDKTERKRGQRKCVSKKWNGVAKKESQIGTVNEKNTKPGREVIYIDLDRIVPERNKNYGYFYKLKSDTTFTVQKEINDYVSYVMEDAYQISAFNANPNSFAYKEKNTSYTSFNSASGEDVITKIVTDIVAVPKNSLVLIEEIEVGLHPEYIRRLMDVIFNESSINQKQFIITTHSPIVMSLVNPDSRIFIDNNDGDYKTIEKVSINEAFCKMDSKNFPLVNLYVEDDVSEKIVMKILGLLNIDKKYQGIKDLIKIVISGSAEDTYKYFSYRKKYFKSENAKIGFACILDGDMRYKYQDDEGLLFFHYSDEAPEKFLVKKYLEQNPNTKLEYNLTNINVHFLFKKMVELNISISTDDAFEKCWKIFEETDDGKKFIEEMKKFLIHICDYFAPNL